MALADGAAAREEIAEHVATIRAASAYNEAATVKAMQQLFSMCRSKTPGHLANQAAAAEAGGVAALLELVGQGSTRSRTWAFNTLGRLCFDHADNAAQVCESGAIEAAVKRAAAAPAAAAAPSSSESSLSASVQQHLTLSSV